METSPALKRASPWLWRSGRHQAEHHQRLVGARWNTQNVTVSNNTFTYDADAGCTTQSSQHNYCAVTGLFSTSMTSVFH